MQSLGKLEEDHQKESFKYYFGQTSQNIAESDNFIISDYLLDFVSQKKVNCWSIAGLKRQLKCT